MSLTILGFLLISSMSFIDSTICRADDGGFYQQLRKKKNPTRAEIKEIQGKTQVEERRKAVNAKADEVKAHNEALDKIKDDQDDDKDDGKDDTNDDDPLKDINAETLAEAKAILANPKAKKDNNNEPTTTKAAPSKGAEKQPKIQSTSDGPAIKVDPGNTDELIYPVAAPETKKPAPKKK